MPHKCYITQQTSYWNKCQSLHMEQCNPGCTYRQEVEVLPVERDLWGLGSI